MTDARKPDGWRWRYEDETTWTVHKHKPRWWQPFMTDVILEPLYADPHGERLDRAARAVETWWLEQGQHSFDGAPAAIFALREALKP